jgi:F0F1-type ATP synthase membrane subunit b/b'
VSGEDKLGELREATRLANQVLKDLKQERKEATELVQNYVAKLEKTIGAELVKQLDELGKATQKAMDDSVTRVFKKFDELAALMMGEEKSQIRKGEPSISDLVKYRQSLKENN